jgi:hypothetical protein
VGQRVAIIGTGIGGSAAAYYIKQVTLPTDMCYFLACAAYYNAFAKYHRSSEMRISRPLNEKTESAGGLRSVRAHYIVWTGRQYMMGA